MEGSEMEALHDEIEADYDMADMIRTKVIPNAVAWCAVVCFGLGLGGGGMETRGTAVQSAACVTQQHW